MEASHQGTGEGVAAMTGEWDGLNLKELPDERLAVLAVQNRSQAARHELVLRYVPWIAALVEDQGRKLSLRKQDMQDAGQELMVFLLQKGIASYHGSYGGAESAVSFRQFLAMVMPKRCKDVVRNHGRKRKWFGQCLGFAGAEGENGPAGLGLFEPADNEDPLNLAQRHEFARALAQLVEQLDPRRREAWQRLLAEEKLTIIADALKVSLRTVSRIKDELCDKYQALWRRYFPGAPADSCPDKYSFSWPSRLPVVVDVPCNSLASLVYDASGRTTVTIDPVCQRTTSFYDTGGKG